MTRDGIAGRWRQLKGLARQQWGRATGDNASVVAGKRQQMLGTIQATYGVTRQANEKQLAEWFESQHKNDPIHK